MSLKNFLKKREFIRNIVVFLCTFMSILIFFYFVRFPIVDGNSMYPTYMDGDWIAVLHTHRVSHNDVVVIWSDALEEYLVKRVIGVAGDHIVIDSNVLYVNDVPIYEVYLNEHAWADLNDSEDLYVPEGCIYVMGDNRNDSVDSRILGVFDTDCVYGKAIFHK